MTAPSLVDVQSVRDVILLNASSGSAYSDQLIGSNIRAASWFLERATGRILSDQTQTLKFTTNNAATVYLPGLRSASSVTLNGSALTADSSYWLVPDVQQSGVYLACQFRPFGRGGDYRAYPDWFDTNKDSPKWNAGYREGSLPNDLVIAGSWGYTDALMPEPVRDATKRLAAWLTLRSDVLLSGVRVTETGAFDLSSMPTEVQMFVADWKTGPQAVGL